MVSLQSPKRQCAALLQYSIGALLFPLEPQYGAFVVGHHVLIRWLAPERLRPPTYGERLYVAAGIAFHTVGVAFADRLYRAFGWYDNAAHLLSGSIVAGLLVVVLARYVDNNRQVALLVLAALLPVGLAWEMYEFHVPHLTVYGWRDSASDIWLNAVGGTAMLGYLTVRGHSSGLGSVRGEDLPDNTYVLTARGRATTEPTVEYTDGPSRPGSEHYDDRPHVGTHAAATRVVASDSAGLTVGSPHQAAPDDGRE